MIPPHSHPARFHPALARGLATHPVRPARDVLSALRHAPELFDVEKFRLPDNFGAEITCTEHHARRTLCPLHAAQTLRRRGFQSPRHTRDITPPSKALP